MASLGNDLAKIRKAQELSLDDIHEATKIPKHILSSIEDDSIFSDFEENPTYIRSYVRSYAKALSIDESQIVYALDKKQKDNYKGSLKKLLGDEEKHLFEFDEEDTSDSEDADEESTPDESTDLEPSGSEEEPSKPDPIPQPAVSQKDPGVHSVDWADMGRRFQPLRTTKSKMWIGLLFILLIGALGIYIYAYEFDAAEEEQAANLSNTQPQEPANDEIVSDSLQLDISPTVDTDTSSPAANTDENTETLGSESLEALPDTLSLVLYAAYGKLEPARVYTDITDGINPYWIEEGNAIRFNFVNEIRIRGQISRMVLLMNGHVIPNIREEFYNPDTRLLEIERSYFESDSTWLQPAPDSLEIDAPPPSNIQNRPTFN